MERVGHDGKAPLGMDQLDGPDGRQSGGHTLVEIEPQQVPVDRADFLADDDVHAEPRMVSGEHSRLEGAGDRIVVGEREHVDASRGGPHQVLRGLGAVAPPRVHVKVRAPEGPSVRSSQRTEAVHTPSIAPRGLTGSVKCR